MPERKWIHRSRNSQPDSLSNDIVPSFGGNELRGGRYRYLSSSSSFSVSVSSASSSSRAYMEFSSSLIHGRLPSHAMMKLLRAAPTLTCEKGVVTVGRRSAGLYIAKCFWCQRDFRRRSSGGR